MFKRILIAESACLTDKRNARVIVLIGVPGAGKGTQARFLSEQLRCPHISTGDIFRTLRSEKTEAARKLQSLMDAGQLLPHGLVMDVVRERTAKADCVEGYILDGFPRTTEQAQMLEVVSKERRHDIVAILIELPKAILRTRIEGRRLCPQCGEIYNTYHKTPQIEGLCDRHPNVALVRRQEDQLEKLETRLHDFEVLTVPVVTYYENSERLIRVDGTESQHEIHEHILRSL